MFKIFMELIKLIFYCFIVVGLTTFCGLILLLKDITDYEKEIKTNGNSGYNSGDSK